MNIFILDWDINKNVEYYFDKHVVKMPVETAQILCQAHYYADSDIEIPYKKAYYNHPSSVWARTSLTNYLWLAELGLQICDEYTYRYKRQHKARKKIEWAIINKPRIIDIGFTNPPTLVTEHCRLNDTVESYRKLYQTDKKHLARWKDREVPNWFIL